MCETAAALMQAARKALIAADIEGSALDARLLLQAASGLSHEQLVAQPDVVLGGDAVAQFRDFLHRRLAHEPVSRILRSREFYGRNFAVTPAVLDPRPDTETLIELVLQLVQPHHQTVLDLGAGSGAIVITLLAELSRFRATAVDLSSDALAIVEHNAIALGVMNRLKIHQGSWFEGLADPFDVIVSNPPYIAHSDIPGLGEEVKNFDPHLALDGGENGLVAYSAIAVQAPQFLVKGGLLVLEIGAGQDLDVIEIFKAQGFKLVERRKDLGGHVRALAFEQINSPEKNPL